MYAGWHVPLRRASQCLRDPEVQKSLLRNDEASLRVLRLLGTLRKAAAQPEWVTRLASNSEEGETMIHAMQSFDSFFQVASDWLDQPSNLQFTDPLSRLLPPQVFFMLSLT